MAGAVGLGLAWWGGAPAQERTDAGASAREPETRTSIRSGQAELVRIEREIADLDAIRKAQAVLIEWRRVGGDPALRLDTRLCVGSALRGLCARLGETFGEAIGR